MSTIAVSTPAELLELTPYAPTRSTITDKPLSPEELRKTEIYWRACNYLSLGMIYLQENPLLAEPLLQEHIKNRLLGHWGSSPGLSFVYVHLNRLIKKFDLDMIFWRGRATALPASSVRPTSKERIRRSIRRRVLTRKGSANFFASFHFPAASAVTARRKLPGPFTKAESSATYCLMLAARLSTIPN